MTDATILRTTSSQKIIQQYDVVFLPSSVSICRCPDKQLYPSLYIQRPQEPSHFKSPLLGILGCLRGTQMKKEKDMKSIIP